MRNRRGKQNSLSKFKGVRLMGGKYRAFIYDGYGNVSLGSWDDTTRPSHLSLPAVTWTRLRVLRTEAGAAGDHSGVVEFRAHFRDRSEPDALHERSTFRRDADGRWRYVAAE